MPRTLTLESLEARQVFASLADFRLADGWNEVQRPSSGDIQPGLVKIQEDLDLVRLVQRFSDQELLQLDKVDRSLLKLYGQWLDNPQINPLSDLSPNANDWSSELVVDQQRPYVKFFVDDAQQAAGELSKLGMEIEHVTDTESWQIVMGYLPVDRIGDAAKLTGLATLAAGVAPEFNGVGAASNAWETVSHSDQLNRMFFADGTGIDIGIISDSINKVGGGIQDSQDSGDLPSDDSRIDVLDDGAGDDTDEGRGMAELMFDVGDGFDFLFHTGNSSGKMEGAFAELAAAGADVIVDDVSFLDEPLFQDGPIAQAIDDAFHDTGVLIFGSAGNMNGQGYADTFVDADGDDYHEFAGGDETLNFTLTSGNEIDFYLQWNEAWGDASSDIDLEIWDASVTTKLKDSNDWNRGGNPFEGVHLKNSDSTTKTYHLAIKFVSGDSPVGHTLNLVTRDPNGAATFLDGYGQDDAGIAGNHAAVSMLAIGAAPYWTPNKLETFSSH
ncbi:MAG TPA: hypothetical protein PLV92_04550, partial [Pirellulaceae bacterium]|nr:hypothetical protein [Pirellulaceae bacterium]